MKKITISIVLILSMLSSFAQQDVQYTMYFSNKLALNPAYAGSRNAISAVLLYRTQWVGFAGAPVSQSFSIHSPIFNAKNGIGLVIEHDKLGINDNMNFRLAYAYRIKFKNGQLAFGFDAQAQRVRMNWATTDPITNGDATIPYADDNILLLNFGGGIFYKSEKYYAGISIPHLLENKLDFGTSTTATTTETQAAHRRHYFGMAGAVFPITENIKFMPSIMMKYVTDSPFEADFTANFLFYEKFLIGGSYRSFDSFALVAQIILKNGMRFGYAHDFTATELNVVHSGTHEVMLAFDFGLKTKGFHHPRYF